MKYILFDLDGTLSDSREGIIKTLVYALGKRGITVEDEKTLLPLIGPPLKESFIERFHMTDEEATETLEIFRERYGRVGKFENEMYDHIPQLLNSLFKEGYMIGLATSKPEVYAIDILKHFNIYNYFSVVVGASIDDKFSKKKEIMEKAICLGKEKEALIDNMIMVGDRSYDMESSKELGVTAIGVTYGFGSRDELERTGATYVVDSVPELEEKIKTL